MSVLALAFGVALLIGVVMIVIHGAGRPRHAMHPTGVDSGSDISWLPAVMSSDGGSSCSGADAGSGCDGGGGGGGD